ncbi:MAG TPA: amino acid ABC transporter ATP-binding protein [Casimicrobiaceae bacterium]|jgi:polar amino acid transport system ATP-binding protein|nr:amino acid ABC transporter ATP-binding protein [Casimicrobiaceae bacterium]
MSSKGHAAGASSADGGFAAQAGESPGQPVIEISGVSKWFGSLQVLKDVTLTVAQGSTVVICGPSGSGKSTLLRCINGLEPFTAGSLHVLGRDMKDPGTRASGAFRAQIGMVFQRFSLYPNMSVKRNLTLALRKVLSLPEAHADQRARKMLDLVGLPDKIEAYPAELSGGQQQRVAIARALVMEPKIMLFDEPTSALDPEIIREVLDVMRDLARRGMTMLVVTHEMGFAREVADQVVFMDGGSVVETGRSDEFFGAPKTRRAQTFIDHILRH